jgi:hypothetical protein
MPNIKPATANRRVLNFGVFLGFEVWDLALPSGTVIEPEQVGH